MGSDIFHDTNFKLLYHLTDYIGYGMTIKSNALKAQRQAYISTTSNKHVSSIHGRSHYHFKFVLDASSLVKDYGGFHYQDHVIEIGNGRRSRVPLH